jgi:hypothetical protein
MTQLYEPMRNSSQVRGDRWAGWVAFATIMLALSGSINLVQGFVALFQDGYFLVRTGDHLLVTGYTTWGVIMLVWGALLVAAAFGLGTGRGWARWLAIVIACLSILVQIGFLSAYPIWSAIIIGFDVIVLFALTAHWTEARTRM